MAMPKKIATTMLMALAMIKALPKEMAMAIAAAEATDNSKQVHSMTFFCDYDDGRHLKQWQWKCHFQGQWYWKRQQQWRWH